MLDKKSEATLPSKKFHKMIATHFQTKIQVFRVDNGKEYSNSILLTYILENGNIYFSLCNNRPYRNGVAKRKN